MSDKHNEHSFAGLKHIRDQRGNKSVSLEPLPYVWASAAEPRLNGFWLIKKLIPRCGIALIYGHPGTGKSFLALDFAFHVALGLEWQGRKVNQGTVIYVAAEGSHGLINRATAFMKQHQIGQDKQIPLAIISTPIDLLSPAADTTRLIETIRAAAVEAGLSPVLVIIDTISKTFGAGKENSDDMATYVANCERVASEMNCCVMPVHHRPKNADGSDPRGHSSLKGGCDTTIICESKKTHKEACVKKQKEGEEGETFLFDLVPIEIGKDEDDETVTSCYIRHIGESSQNGKQRDATTNLSEGQRKLLDLLRQVTATHGQEIPDRFPDDLIDREITSLVAHKADMRSAWLDLGQTEVGHPSAFGTEHSMDRSMDSHKRYFARHLKRLEELKIIGIFEDYIWVK